MAPVSKKRGQAAAVATNAKKARISDPITEKMECVSKAISDPECQLQDSHREMLLLAIPHVLTTPSDDRHEYQTQVAQMVGDVLKKSVEHWELQVSESKDNVGASAQKAADTMKLVEESAAKIGNQEEEVKKCKGIVDENVQAVKAAEEALQCASKEVAEFDQNLLTTTADKDQCNSVYNDHFTPLKDGGLDAKEVTTRTKEVLAILKKLSAEPSLLSAITPAFKKSSAERGPFDTMAIEGAENIIKTHVAKLQEQIDKADEIKAEKVSAETVKQEELKAAMEKRTSSEDSLKAAEDELAAMEAKHLDLFKDCNAAAEESNASEAVVAAKESSCAAAQFALSQFTELFERKTVMPESSVESSAVEEKLEAVCESSPMELTTVA
eukprot:gnl/MRDRNA2_/MRDRNA2_88132_c0_seq1.p1 gnl/MRDRNA2_/MRDRNA2_88132_c0~~gnl/MRDRNA2_/MRDRNA2_88132_c0_seq1.p1  ORF type:complete len:383 (+),score=137.56 gnl/MRDRNA2_/MRDRNA2_88132_c0_seq1:95-1243(+)